MTTGSDNDPVAMSTIDPMDRHWVARKLGLEHKQRNRVLDRAIVRAGKWFAENGGLLVDVSRTGDESADQKITLMIRPPTVPRRRSVIRSKGGKKSRQADQPDDQNAGYFAAVEAVIAGRKIGAVNKPPERRTRPRLGDERGRD